MLPSWWRKAVGVGPSTELLVTVDESGSLVLETRLQGLGRARALVRKYIPRGPTLVGRVGAGATQGGYT